MALALTLYEDTPFAGDRMSLDGNVPRALYVSAGQISLNGTDYPEDEGVTATGGVALSAGAEGATIWRWELAETPADAGPRSRLCLSGAVDPAAIGDELLIRLDSVAFPADGSALLHTHRGPGIRCLREGTIRIDTEGRSASYGPGGAWFEGGPEPVFAKAAADRASRFIRAMILPRALLGASSIRYVNDADKDKPKSQSYRVFAETPFDLP